MALVVEDGTGVDGANSYNSLDNANTFFTARGLVVPTEGQLLQAMDTIELQCFHGTKTISDSALSFPRTGVADRNGIPYSENYIPPDLIRAQLWLAHYIRLGSDPSAPVGPQVKREQVDVLETEYFGEDASSDQVKLSSLPNFYDSIKHLLSDYSSATTASAGRVIHA